DRSQQQPFGILRADAALGELHVDDRNLDIRLRLLRDRHIGDEPRREQEQQRRDGQPRVADGVVDELRHAYLVVAVSAHAGPGSTVGPSRTRSWPCTITRAPSGMPATHMKVCSSSTTCTGTKTTRFPSSTVRTPMSPADEIVSAERGTRVAGT